MILPIHQQTQKSSELFGMTIKSKSTQTLPARIIGNAFGVETNINTIMQPKLCSMSIKKQEALFVHAKATK